MKNGEVLEPESQAEEEKMASELQCTPGTSYVQPTSLVPRVIGTPSNLRRGGNFALDVAAMEAEDGSGDLEFDYTVPPYMTKLVVGQDPNTNNKILVLGFAVWTAPDASDIEMWEVDPPLNTFCLRNERVCA